MMDSRIAQCLLIENRDSGAFLSVCHHSPVASLEPSYQTKLQEGCVFCFVCVFISRLKKNSMQFVLLFKNMFYITEKNSFFCPQ